MKKVMILILAILGIAVSQETMAQQDIAIPFSKGQKEIALKIDPMMYHMDQVFDLEREYEKALNLKGEDFNIFVLHEGYSFRFQYHGDEEYGKMMLKSILEKSVILKIGELPYINVIFSSHGGFLLYFSRTPDPFFIENPDIQYRIQKWDESKFQKM